ncbi:MAG: RNA polymerase subunit sigma-24 [Thiotrichaceae bacterium]|nr:MAG: RNA polymerase subunit sigma-24 [Thiotrichaceae bacterium]
MPELLLRPRKRYSAISISRFSVKEICAIVSVMSLAAENQNKQPIQSEIQSDSMRLNAQLKAFLVKIAGKDKSAFEQFYDSSIKLCFSQAMRITSKEEIAEEVVSDVYMQVWNTAVSYDEQRSGVMTWLMMLCRSRALDALRKQKSRQARESVNIDAIAEPAIDETPQDLLNAVQQGSVLHRAIEQLKPQQRQLLSLAYFKNLSHNEIASYTDTPLGTVKTQIRRAIIKLKEIMNVEKLSEGESYEKK